MRPKILIKAAISVDGKIATKTGESQWISNEQSRAYVHELRASHDAIMVGANTLVIDDPRLTIRHDQQEERSSYRIIVDSKGRSPLHSKVFNDAFKHKTLLVVTEIDSNTENKLFESGVHILKVKSNHGRVDLTDMMHTLYDFGIQSIFVEGGGELIAALIEERLVDQLSVAIGPMIIGGKEAKSFVGGEGIVHLSQALKLHSPKIRNYDDDVIIEYQVQKED
jgi:diaminohydroxyphosphoribosylaminopyrimidine deaminase / 5-amino-6-(5-phosphoribosylamino)uracil reductase